MMFNKERKICFSLLPRCGSVSLRSLLISLGMKEVLIKKSLSMFHTKYKDAVGIYPNLANYLIYGVIRNPAKRLVSALNFPHVVQPIAVNALAKNEPVSVDVIKEHVARNSKNFLYEPQYSWFEKVPNFKVIDFDNLQAGLDEALAFLDGDKSLPHRNKTASKRIELTPEIEAFARGYYAADYEFAKNVLGKEY